MFRSVSNNALISSLIDGRVNLNYCSIIQILVKVKISQPRLINWHPLAINPYCKWPWDQMKDILRLIVSLLKVYTDKCSTYYYHSLTIPFYTRSGAKSGSWVLLRNVHLCIEWLNVLDKRLQSTIFPTANPSFRLFLTCEIHPKLSPPLLRMSDVIVFEGKSLFKQL